MTESPRFTRPRKLQGNDNLEGFLSGEPDLDEWLKKFAFTNQQSGMASVFVSTSAGVTAGYYALSTGGVEHNEAPARIKSGVARHPIPVILLSRLAVGATFQGHGLGRMLVRDALIRIDRASDEIGIRALLIHAKNEAARDFYLNIAEFDASPTDDLHLFLLMKDLRKTIQG